MQKKLAAILFSTRLTAVLFIIFAVAMGVGTFMDASSSTSPTPYSRHWIYNAWWFEAIMIVFVINFIGNIARFRLWRKEKWATLTIHLSFILIIVGAGVTRYIGYEGRMPIREGATADEFLSQYTYVDAFIQGDYKVDGVAMQRNVPPLKVDFSERLNNDFSIETDYNKIPVSITYKGFMSNIEEGFIPSEDGQEYLKIVEAGDGNRHDHWVKVGEVMDIHNILFALNKPTRGAINITISEDNQFSIESPFEGSYMRMADRLEGDVVADSTQTFNLRSLYQMAGMAFVIPEPVTKGNYGVVKTTEETNMNALTLAVSANGETKEVEVLGGQYVANDPLRVDVGGLKVYLTYGSKKYKLPFSITLNDFIADKQPGTEKVYAAFKSKITVNDSDQDFFDYDIFMNHVLDHKGYRFFQASFHPDEKGTVLSVNKDFWGTWITYIGYFLLYLGLMAILFDRNTRFADLKRLLDKVKDKKAKLATLILVLFSFGVTAQDGHSGQRATPAQIDSIIKANAVSKEHATAFGNLVIQDNGRMKPLNTFASELLRKVSGKDEYQGLDANQVFLSMTELKFVWYETPVMKLDWRNDSIKTVIGVTKESKNASLFDLFDAKGNNKLGPYLEKASAQTNPNQFEKDFIKLYEKSSLLSQALSGSILKIFPVPGDEGNKWVSFPELQEHRFTGMDSMYARNILPLYFESLQTARTTGNYDRANEFLESMTNFQKKHGSEVLLSENKVKAEVLYNKIDLFNRLFHYLSMFGVFMLLFIIFQIFKDWKLYDILIKICKFAIWGLFILMSAGLVARWYISGHAPWSDAYESIIYVSWATMFFGLAFGRKSDLTIAATAFVVSILLWVAHMSWLDPAIANLQPVLDSYWLMIHVAVIVASYGPFTLGMILGAVALLLILLTNSKNKKKMELNIKEILIITEMALTVGLVMLVIGNFLGGQWANESWGRYWGWDPKETWALISIMVYAFVIHARLVPGLRGKWFFSVMSIFAYASIMMTYFGVNFYLTGLHSYASGDVPVTPEFVYYLLTFFVVLSIASHVQYRKHYIKKG